MYKFVKLSEEEYRKFWEKSIQKNFLSAPEIAHLKAGAKVLFYGVEEKGKVVAAALIRGTKNAFGYDFYSPRGILVDYNNVDLLNFFVSKLKSALRKAGGYNFRIEPNVELIERDIDGNIVPDGYNNESVVKNLEVLGFRHVKFVEGVSQVTWKFVLPLKGKTIDDVLNGMKNSARRCLRQATALGVEIKHLKKEEVHEFYDILMQTASRKKFVTRDFDYYQKVFDEFSPKNVQFVSAVIRPKECLKRLYGEKENILAEKPVTNREKKDHEDAIKSIDARIAKAENLLGDIDRDEITLSSGIFFTIKPEVLFFSGGNDTNFMKLDGQYVMQWEMIKYAVEHGYDRFDFFGIPENIDKHPANYGVYEFKRGFNGKVEQLVGEFELPLSFKFYVVRFLHKIKKLL